MCVCYEGRQQQCKCKNAKSYAGAVPCSGKCKGKVCVCLQEKCETCQVHPALSAATQHDILGDYARQAGMAWHTEMRAVLERGVRSRRDGMRERLCRGRRNSETHVRDGSSREDAQAKSAYKRGEATVVGCSVEVREREPPSHVRGRCGRCGGGGGRVGWE